VDDNTAFELSEADVIPTGVFALTSDVWSAMPEIIPAIIGLTKLIIITVVAIDTNSLPIFLFITFSPPIQLGIYKVKAPLLGAFLLHLFAPSWIRTMQGTSLYTANQMTYPGFFLALRIVK